MSDPDLGISQKILFVDDETLLLEGVKRQLRRELNISVAEGGAAGLSMLEEQGPFAVVVSDYNMPGMDGVAFLNQVYQKYPYTVLVMLTGRAELNVAVNALHNAHISRFLNKPCPREILLETLNDGLEQYRLRMSEQILQRRLQEANRQLNQLNNHLESLVEKKTLALQMQYRYAARMATINESSAIVETLINTISELMLRKNITLWLSPLQDGNFTCYYPLNLPVRNFVGKNCPAGFVSDILGNNRLWLRDDENTSSITDFDRSLFDGEPWMSVPLQSKQGVLGVLNLAGSRIEIKADVLEALTGMADVTATALQSLWHREASDEAQDAIITALAKLSEYRDPETGAHLERLKKYCELICRFLGGTEKYKDVVTPEFSKDLARSSPLHDIGKVGIPDAILKKPGRLSPEEFEIMKNHAAIGGDTLRALYENYPSQGFIKCGMDVAYGHHEKWNGSGYPLGLKGEEIPLPARILALVDVYDALTCRRVYKPPFPREQAKAMIVDGDGSHFDPDLVAAFLSIEEDFHRIAEEYADIL